MSTAPIFGDPLEIDVGLRGIANDGIHCDGGLGANCYASCHETHGVNSHHYEYAANPFESV